MQWHESAERELEAMDATEYTAAVVAQRADEAPFVNLRDPAKRVGPDGKPAVSHRARIW